MSNPSGGVVQGSLESFMNAVSARASRLNWCYVRIRGQIYQVLLFMSEGHRTLPAPLDLRNDGNLYDRRGNMVGRPLKPGEQPVVGVEMFTVEEDSLLAASDSEVIRFGKGR
jgi:hypothetical protein